MVPTAEDDRSPSAEAVDSEDSNTLLKLMLTTSQFFQSFCYPLLNSTRFSNLLVVLKSIMPPVEDITVTYVTKVQNFNYFYIKFGLGLRIERSIDFVLAKISSPHLSVSG